MAHERERAPDAAILQQLFRDSPLPIAVYSTDGVLQHSNDAHEAFADALGEVSGIGAFNALYDLRSERYGHRAPFQRAVAGEVLDYAFTVRPDASAPAPDTLHFHRMLLPTYDQERGSAVIVSVIIDVSEFQHAERDKARLHAELQQAQKTEGLGLLAGSIAHDFNNLLVGVLGNVSLLLERLEPGSSLRRTAESIELAARRAADVARQLLAYAGKGRFRVEELSLSELAREISELLRITLSQRAELRMELAQHIATIQADATQMRQVVMNLVTNARDAVEHGGVITLRTGELPASRVDLSTYLGRPDPSTSDFVFLDVEDSGKGMDVHTAAHIFDPFFTTKPSGRGLGLSAVLGIVRSHGGALRVESTLGQGTTMRVLLPAYGQPAKTLKLIPPPPPALDSPSTPSGHVLVIDDEEMIRALLANMLEALGYSVTSAASVPEALHALAHEAKSACCVLLDLNMPQQDGNEAFARIRACCPQLPVVFMSGYEARAAPLADGFVHKPFTMDDLRTALSQVITGPSGPGRASPPAR